jgi:NADPH:quinone reductase-like Zn-dependent oxidoreductase
MKAIVYEQYGSPDVLKLREVPKPAPKANEVLIKVQAVGLNAADWHMLRADPFLVRFEAGLTAPKRQILGADIAGQVEAVGGEVTQFKPGDAVYGEIAGCGWGGLAEYVCARADCLAPKPANLSWEQAAAVPMAALTALQALRDKGNVQPGQKVLIHGAGGGVGTFAVQLAKLFGAEVTAVCGARNASRVQALGADRVIDYTKEDFAQAGAQYDLILGVNGSRSLADYRRALRPGGQYVMVGGSTGQIFQAMLLGPLYSLAGGKKMGNLLAHASQADLIYLKELLEAGKIAPVIDRCHPLEETAAAMRYLEMGHAQGKIVVSVSSAAPA